jgi:PHD/YefM family antitoxin component YafN of YafNO toxin-antitoxin module
MKYVSTKELDQGAATLVASAQHEPVTIRDDGRDVAVLLSAADYQKLTSQQVDDFNRFCDMIGERAAARGLTEQKLAQLLAEDG